MKSLCTSTGLYFWGDFMFSWCVFMNPLSFLLCLGNPKWQDRCELGWVSTGEGWWGLLQWNYTVCAPGCGSFYLIIFLPSLFVWVFKSEIWYGSSSIHFQKVWDRVTIFRSPVWNWECKILFGVIMCKIIMGNRLIDVSLTTDTPLSKNADKNPQTETLRSELIMISITLHACVLDCVLILQQITPLIRIQNHASGEKLKCFFVVLRLFVWQLFCETASCSY